MKAPPGSQMTLGNNAANAKVRLIVWCKACGHQVEPDPVEMVARYGADTSPEILRSATVINAELLMQKGNLGTVSPGRTSGTAVEDAAPENETQKTL